jgi:GNAT superfamily N-acetyltransferase
MGSEITVRTALPADEAQTLTLLEELFAPPGKSPVGYTRTRGAVGFRHAIESENADILLAFDGDGLVGLATVYVDFPSLRFGWRCWLEDLVVTASRRSSGVGRTLLGAARDWARARGCTHLELNSATTRTDAHRFYGANGMVQDSLSFALRID